MINKKTEILTDEDSLTIEDLEEYLKKSLRLWSVLESVNEFKDDQRKFEKNYKKELQKISELSLQLTTEHKHNLDDILDFKQIEFATPDDIKKLQEKIKAEAENLKNSINQVSNETKDKLKKSFSKIDEIAREISNVKKDNQLAQEKIVNLVETFYKNDEILEILSSKQDNIDLEAFENSILEKVKPQVEGANKVVYINQSTGYTAMNLARLVDVYINNPTNGQTLIYDSSIQRWVNSNSGGGAVDSVNGQTGVVVLDADDIDDTSTTNKFVTASDLTNLSNLSGTNTGDQNLFSTIAVSGQSNVVADSTGDTLTLVAGSNITITTNASTDSVTIASTGGSASPAGSDTQVQFNDAGSFGADADLTYNKTTNALTVGGLVHTPVVQAHTSAGLTLEAQGGGDVLLVGAGGGINATAYGGWNFDAATASTLASFGASKTLSSLSTTTYPDLTEISYVKGVTSAIQTQINTKISASSTDTLTNKTVNLTSNTLTGTKAQFDTACSDGNFLYVGDVTQYTDEQAQDAVGSILTDTATIDFTYSDATPSITADVLAVPVANEASDTTCFPLFVTSATGNLAPKSNTGLTYNSATNNLAATTFSGALSGNATTATTLQTARAIYGNNFDGSAALTQIIASTYGGTGNGFTKFTGAATSEKTYTLPNATCSILTDNATVTAAQGGTGIATYTIGDIIYASASTTFSKLAGVATGNALISGGVATAPSWGKIGLTTHVSGTLGAANGGTGVANNAASTITISGNFGTTFTVSGTTSVTLPTTGTLATLAGSESLTNKKLGSLTTNGFVKTSGSDGTLSVDTIAYNSTGFNFIINGNGSTITTGNKNGFVVPFNCTITAVTMGADQSGSIVVDIWKDTYANYPPTVADTITASAKPTISSATKSTDSTLTGWTKTLTAGDWLFFNVDSVTSITKLCIFIAVTRT